jgi:hypothetical protein
MNPSMQTVLALVIVAIAATCLLVRALAKRKNPGCGGDCGCATDEFKSKLKR